MSFGPGTAVVDGQRNTFPTSAAFSPASYGPSTTGVPIVSPSMPPYVGAGNGAGSSLGAGMEGVGNYGTAGNNSIMTATAAANPWSLKVSPVLWAIGALIVGLVALRAVHWRRTIVEGSASVES